MDEANQSDRGTTIRLGLGKQVEQLIELLVELFWLLLMSCLLATERLPLALSQSECNRAGRAAARCERYWP